MLIAAVTREVDENLWLFAGTVMANKLFLLRYYIFFIVLMFEMINLACINCLMLLVILYQNKFVIFGSVEYLIVIEEMSNIQFDRIFQAIHNRVSVIEFMLPVIYLTSKHKCFQQIYLTINTSYHKLIHNRLHLCLKTDLHVP